MSFYVEELIGPDTVNTMPLATLNAFLRSRLCPRRHSDGGFRLAEAQQTLGALAHLGIDLDGITNKLQVDGIAAFAADYDRVLAALEKQRRSMTGESVGQGHR
jgi:transaldolase